jgi:pimeloyl-ACP methyl ester carboxylesterase
VSNKAPATGAAVEESRIRQFTRRGVMRTAAAAGITYALPSSVATLLSPAGAAAIDRLVLPPATEAITPFRLHAPVEALRDLRRRLANTRLPEQETVSDWSQGAPRDRVRDLVRYWGSGYDWRNVEKRLNALGQHRTEIDELGIHFLHVRSRHTDALPIILTHGWPGSIVEFLKVIGPMTDPTAHGGRAEDAFHVVIPSLPGFGLSDKPTDTNWGLPRIAKAWDTLMKRLGYTDYIAQGGDWGGAVSTRLGKLRPPGLLGIHVNFPEFVFTPPLTGGALTPEEQVALGQLQNFANFGSGYFKEQSTRPQTVGYALADSPAGQAAWIYEKFGEWTDTDFHPERELTNDEMLDDITLYWLTSTAASSARLYWEYAAEHASLITLDLPAGISVFPGEGVRVPKIWAERAYSNLVYFNDQIPAGGHFAAFEQPQLFTEEVRKFARKVR